MRISDWSSYGCSSYLFAASVAGEREGVARVVRRIVGGIHVGEAGQEDQAEPEEKSRRRNAAPALGNACPSLCGLSPCSCCRLHEVLQLPMILLEKIGRASCRERVVQYV